MKNDPVLKTLAVLSVVFGLLSIFSGGRALFGDAQARVAVGNAVGFVLWFNFLAGFSYVVVGRRSVAWPSLGHPGSDLPDTNHGNRGGRVRSSQIDRWCL
jgi:hypothetical protein